MASFLFTKGKLIFFALPDSELDNSTTSTYETYAMSEFRTLSMGGTLDVIGALVSASVKVPIAKISDVIGRGETYCLMTLLLMISYVLHALAQGFPSFVVGSLFFLVGQAGIALLDFIVVSDVTSMRSRALVGNLLYSPYLIITWLSGIIVDRVKDGIGWRWGYGMFVFITPMGYTLLIMTLLYLQRKAKAAGYATSKRTTLKEFCSRIDLGGSLLLTSGLACILLPITLAAQSHDHWKSAWVSILILLGIVLLVCLVIYEALFARHPVMPVSYFHMRAIMVAFFVMSIDACGYRITHTYLFAWSIATHNYSARTAMYLTYISGLTQLLTGIVVGLVIYRLRFYKWVSVGGSFIRAFGYAMMIRVRTNSSTTFELFAVQMIQGLGSGFLETSMFVAAQIMVPHAELAQVTALIATASHIGGGVGSAIAGGIYTTSMKGRLRARLGPDATESQIDGLYDSITGVLPEWGTEGRTAVAAAVRVPRSWREVLLHS